MSNLEKSYFKTGNFITGLWKWFTVKRMQNTILKVNRQRPTSVMRRPELKTPTLPKWLISPLVRVKIKICKKHLVLKTNSNINILIKHEFLDNSCKPVCKPLPCFLKVPSISKTLSNSGMKIIQLVYGELAHQLAKYGANVLARFVFTTDWNFLEGKLNAGKTTVLRLRKLNWNYCKDLQRVLWSDSMKSLLSTRCIIIVFMHWDSLAKTDIIAQLG